VFESQEAKVSTERWFVYFSALAERDTFLQRLQQTWKMHFEVRCLMGTSDVRTGLVKLPTPGIHFVWPVSHQPHCWSQPQCM